MNLRHALLALTAPVLLLSAVACGSETPAAQTVTSTATTTATTTSVSTSTSKTTLTPEPAGTETVSVTVTETPAPQTVVEATTLPAPGPAVAFDEGTYLVNSEVQPGTYRSSQDNQCYWERRDQSGEIIDNDFGTVMTIQASDFSIDTERCGSWSKVG